MTRASILGLASGLSLALAGGAVADPYADSVDSFDIDNPIACCDDPNDALGMPDAAGASLADFSGFVTLSNVDTDFDGGDRVVLDFDDNLCILSGDGAPDVQVVGYIPSASETFLAAVAQQGGLFSGAVAGSEAAGALDFDGIAPGPFNRIRVVSTNDAGAAPGVDVDAVECLYTLDQADIVKMFTDFSETTIDVGVDTVQVGYSFTIEITNDTGFDGGLAGLTFFDSVPGEFDLDPDGEDFWASPIPFNNVCVDSNPVCDGVDDSLASDCTVTLDTSEGAKKKGKAKLEPEHIYIDASGLNDGDSCLITVFVKTDSKSFPKGKSPLYTPTSCPEDPGEIVLNDGVRVFDASMNLLLDDDDMLTLECNNFTD